MHSMTHSTSIHVDDGVEMDFTVGPSSSGGLYLAFKFKESNGGDGGDDHVMACSDVTLFFDNRD